MPALGAPPRLLFLGREVFRRADSDAAAPTHSKHCRHLAPPERASMPTYIYRDCLRLQPFPTAPGRSPLRNSSGRRCSFGFVHVAPVTLLPTDLLTCAQRFSLLDPGLSWEAEIWDGACLERANTDRQVDKHFLQLLKGFLQFCFCLCSSRVLPLCSNSSDFRCPRSFLDASLGLCKLSMKGSGNLFGLLWASFTEKTEMAEEETAISALFVAL